MDRSNIVYGRHSQEKRELAYTMRRNMTPTEATLWQRLRAGRLRGLHFRRQQIIDGFIADFYCHAVGLVVEVDGPVHEETREYDAERDRILATRGLKLLRIPNDRVLNDIQAVLREIVETATPT